MRAWLPMALCAAMLGAAGNAAATDKMVLNITGTADPGFTSEVLVYDPLSYHFADFSGDAVHIQMEIDSLRSVPFVSSFSVSWGDPSSPFPTSDGGSEYSDPWTGEELGYVSIVSLDATSFNITTEPGGYLGDYCDCGIELAFQIDLAQPWDGAHSIIAKGALGSGSIYEADYAYPSAFGFGDLYAGGNFHITSVVAQVPEPATWTLMIGGFGLAGAAMRRRFRLAAGALGA